MADFADRYGRIVVRPDGTCEITGFQHAGDMESLKALCARRLRDAADRLEASAPIAYFELPVSAQEKAS